MVDNKINQPKVDIVLKNIQVQKTTPTPKVVAPVLATKPVQQIQQQPSQEHQEEITTDNNRGCSLTTVNSEGAVPTEDKLDNRDYKALERKVFADILVKIQPTIRVVPTDTTVKDVTDTMGGLDGCKKRKCLDTASTLTPSISSTRNTLESTLGTSSQGLQLTGEGNLVENNLMTHANSTQSTQQEGGLSQGAHKHDGSTQVPHQPNGCVHQRGGWCSTHLVHARKKVQTWKSWERLKSGLYGNVRRSRTTYKCEIQLKSGEMTLLAGPSASSQQGGEVGRVISGRKILGITGGEKVGLESQKSGDGRL